MRTSCAWCGVVLKEGDKHWKEGEPIESHGICEECMKEYFPDYWEEVQYKKGWKLVQEAREIIRKIKGG